MAIEQSNRAYREIGISDSHHGLTHHGGDTEKIEKCIADQSLPDGAVRLFHRQAESDAGWRRHAVRSCDGDVRQRP